MHAESRLSVVSMPFEQAGARLLGSARAWNFPGPSASQGSAVVATAQRHPVGGQKSRMRPEGKESTS